MTERIYVGLFEANCEVFKSNTEPTQTTHGDKYHAVIGPYRTMRGAKFSASAARTNNPHVQTVADAERIAKQLNNGG